MARGTDLATLRYMLKAEIGDYAGTNTNSDSALNVLLSNKQKWLASDWDWPFLQHFWDVSCSPSQQYVSLPTITADTGITADIDWERPVQTYVFYTNFYKEVQYGIGVDEYNWQNFALGQTTDPIQRYRLVSDASETTSPNKFEVWPVPTTVQTMRFIGQRALQEMVDDTDKADLDDMLLVYFSAADRLLRAKQPDAQLKLELARQRLVKVRSVYPVRERNVVLGRAGEDWRNKRRLVPIVAVHS